MSIRRLILLGLTGLLFCFGPPVVSSGSQSVAAEDSASTWGMVRVAGRVPSLGGFATARTSLDLTSDVVRLLGHPEHSLRPDQWPEWKELDASSTASEGLLLVFADQADAQDNQRLRKVIEAGLERGDRVFVLPSSPDLRIADAFTLRQMASTLRADYVDLGSVAGGNPFVLAMENIQRKLVGASPSSGATAAGPSSRGGGSVASDTEIVVIERVEGSGSRASAGVSPPAGPAGRVSADFQEGERTIFMAPPPAVPSFPRERPVSRDPSQRRLPALAN